MSLQVTTAATASSVEMGVKLAGLKDFATSFQGNGASEGTAIVVPVFASGTDAAAFADGTNDYQNGAEKGVSGATVNLDQHLVKSVVYSDADFMENSALGFWENSGKVIAYQLAKGAIKTVFAGINKTTVTTESVFTLANAKAKDLVANLTAIAANADIDVSEAVLVLSPTYFAAVLSVLDSNTYGGTEAYRTGRIPSLFGFKAVQMSTQLFDGTGENLEGLIVGGEAIGLASRAVIVNSPAAYQEVSEAVDPNTNIAITFRRSVNVQNGKNYLAGEILFGAKLLNAAKIVRLVSAATA